MFRDEPGRFEATCQQIIKGGVSMFGTNWQCVERKKMRGALRSDGEKYDPSLGTQTFRLRDADTMITKKCSVLRKRRRNDDGDGDDDIFNMNRVKRALRCFASTSGSMRDGVSPSSDCSDTLIDGVHSIELGPPDKKRRIDMGGGGLLRVQNVSEHQIGRNKRSERSYGIRIVQEDGEDWFGSPPKRQRLEPPTSSLSAFSFPAQSLKANDRVDGDFEMK